MTGYVGRFAPTPSGPLHFGSIVTAVGSHLDARHAGGRWLVRIDDIDRLRVRPGAGEAILSTLECLGLHWDGEVLFQSARGNAYAAVLTNLKNAGLTFPCTCPRRLVAGGVYPGTCRHGTTAGKRHSLRVFTDNREIVVDDGVQGRRTWNMARDVGDFIVYRSDRVYAYHLAAAVDDAWQDVTRIVRGADLLESTPPQMYLQQRLQLPSPDYVHLPLVLDADGRKLSKSDPKCTELILRRPAQVLVAALRHLGQQVDPDMETGSCREILEAAVRRWNLERVPRTAPPGANLEIAPAL